MSSCKLFAGAGIAAALAALTLYSANAPAERQATVTLELTPPLCSAAGSAGPQRSLAFQLAAASNELKPLGELPQAQQQASQQVADPPLWDNLGSLHYRITTTKPLAQQYFNQGLRLTYAFNHAEAIRAYQMAQRIDPRCAMCYWGEALALGPNINAPMEPAAVAPAMAAIERAQGLAKRVGNREQRMIAALATRYSNDPQSDRAALDAHYADAMGKLAQRYPRDQEIAVLYAEALMNLSPWDYWTSAGTQPKGRTAELVATLERVLKTNPQHPGAIHYYIHTVEASANPRRAEPYAERLAQLVPGAGHLVHMPAHIYYRVGRYRDSLAANQRAVAVDEAYIAAQNPQGIYPQGYYPHNIHFLMVSAQMAGDAKSAQQAADKLATIVTDDTARAFPIAQPVKVAPYFAHAQFSAPDTILALPEPGADLPYVRALWHYARGTAFAARGDIDLAKKESAAIATLLAEGDFTNLSAALVPAAQVLQIAQHVVDARIAQTGGDMAGAIERFEQAAALEDQLAYMEPPYWYYPIQQSLGAARLLHGDVDGAEQAFRASLMKAPNNGWALYGLTEVYKKRGDTQRADATAKLLAQSWAGAREQLTLTRL